MAEIKKEKNTVDPEEEKIPETGRKADGSIVRNTETASKTGETENPDGEAETEERVVPAGKEVSGKEEAGKEESGNGKSDNGESGDGEAGKQESEKEEPGKDKEKKGFHKRNKEDKKTEALHAKIGELEDKVKRQLAEFENFRNRSEKEKSAMFETGARSVIEKILPIVDNFERGLSGLTEEQKVEPFAAGMVMVYKQLQTELENLGVKPIEAVGHEFDPNFHNAVMQVESEEYESGVVAQEMMKGYTYRDVVIRHSMVAVVS